MLTNDDLLSEEPHVIGGRQRKYLFAGGWKVSLIDSPMAHAYDFAWEAAVIDPDGKIRCDTPLTSDVEVFATDDEANAFLAKAKSYFAQTIDSRQALSLTPNHVERLKKIAAWLYTEVRMSGDEMRDAAHEIMAILAAAKEE